MYLILDLSKPRRTFEKLISGDLFWKKITFHYLSIKEISQCEKEKLVEEEYEKLLIWNLLVEGMMKAQLFDMYPIYPSYYLSTLISENLYNIAVERVDKRLAQYTNLKLIDRRGLN